MTWKRFLHHWYFFSGFLSQKDSDAELWCFLFIGSKQAVEQTVEFLCTYEEVAIDGLHLGDGLAQQRHLLLQRNAKYLYINSLAPNRCGSNFQRVIMLKLITQHSKSLHNTIHPYLSRKCIWKFRLLKGGHKAKEQLFGYTGLLRLSLIRFKLLIIDLVYVTPTLNVLSLSFEKLVHCQA